MSVLDEVRALEQRVRQRLRELGPLVAEYRDLEKVAERLGLRRDDDEASEAAAPETGQASPKRTPAAKQRAKRAAAARGPARKPKAAAKAEPKATATPKASAKAKPDASAKQQAAATTKPAPGAKPKRRGATAKPKPGARKTAAPGQREQDVLRLVGERPGVTVAELARELGVDSTGLYGVVRRLQAKGQISKDGTQLRLSETLASAGDAAADIASQSADGAADTAASAGEDAAPAAAEPAGASAIAEEAS